MGKSHSKRKFDGRVEEWKANKKEGEKQAKQKKHFSANQKVIGMITKGNAYAKNGYFQVDTKKRDMKGRKKVYERAKAKPKNYASGNDNFYTLKLPYPIQAHHVLPKDSFSTKKGFTEPQRNLLKRVPWDINHGENIIFLPEDENDCWIHRLPSHRGSHPTYNTDVYVDTQKIQDKLKRKPPCSTDGPQLKIFQQLKRFQNKWWKWLAHKCYKKQGKGRVEDAAQSGV